mmetsp:Transcript_9332/g.12214  ORF Transcript_9332/g.12214 Transcript_9332/m.12214 type:complete len:81 (+) Transcript_9332:425-667(+)
MNDSDIGCSGLGVAVTNHKIESEVVVWNAGGGGGWNDGRCWDLHVNRVGSLPTDGRADLQEGIMPGLEFSAYSAAHVMVS